MPAPLNLPLARAALNRNSEARKDAQLLASLIVEGSAVCLFVSGDKVLGNSQGSGLRLIPVSLVTEIATSGMLAYLGQTIADEAGVAEGTAVVLVDLDAAGLAALEAAGHSQDGDWLTLRRSGFGLSARDAGLVAQALALVNWHRAHGFCANCGTASNVSQAGWSRTCLACKREVFPRNDPAIIVAIVDDEDRILLGSQGTWEENRWSILAGFVDAGETLHAAVEREMLEEAGVKVTDIKFIGSQPWPYPFSLMVGFTARARGEQNLQPDGLEIEKLRWFSREQIAAESQQLLLPGKSTISRAMIEHWYGAPLSSKSDAAPGSR